MIQELCKPVWVVQKQPANHCLKPRGLAIGRWVSTPGTPPRTVAPTTHQISFLVSEQGLKSSESSGLGISPDLSHHRFVQVLGSTGLPAMPQTLMQFPDGIPEPGELERTKIGGTGRKRLLKSDPVAQAASWV